jgi:uncharacterized UPF0160 family protein
MILKDWPPVTCKENKPTVIAKPFTDNSVVAIHTPPHHADEVFCVACVKFINSNVTIIRTRNEEELAKADFRIDVGGKYDPLTGDFDHHQNEFIERHFNIKPDKYKDGPKMAGFGLIWRHYSIEIITSILDRLSKTTGHICNLSNDVLDYIDDNVERNLVMCVDALDNGENKTFNLDLQPVKIPSIVKFIQNYNPAVWLECNKSQETDINDFFYKAVETAQNYLEREVIKYYCHVQAVEPVLEKVSKCKDGYLILDPFLPWGPVFTKFPEECKDIKMVIYPSYDGGWMFQSPYIKKSVDEYRFTMYHPVTNERRKQRYETPSYLCGKEAEDIEKITGIQDTTFIHSAGFVGACKTLEATKALAIFIVNHQEW